MPLAHDLRPKTLEDVIGQNHLLGKDGFITAMIKKNTLLSMILYGNPGTGKNNNCKSFKRYFLKLMPIHLMPQQIQNKF